MKEKIQKIYDHIVGGDATDMEEQLNEIISEEGIDEDPDWADGDDDESELESD